MTVPFRLLAAGAALCVGLSACGSDTLDMGDSPSSGEASGPTSVRVTASADTKLAALVPADIRAKGTLTVGSDASYPPNEFYPVGSKDITGMDVDMFNAVAAKLGLKTSWQNAQFGSILPGIGSKYDVGVSSFTIKKDRLKAATMVSYLTAGVQWAVPAGNPDKIDPANPCGLTVGVQTNTIEVDILDALNKGRCASKPIKVVPESEQTKVNLDLQSGKIDAMTADSPVTQYAISQSNGKIEAAGEVTDAAPYGYVLPRSQTEFGKALVAALESLKADGTYANVMKKWGLTTGALDTFEVNPKVAD